MKKCCFWLLAFSFGANAQIVNIPDPNFKNALINTPCVVVPNQPDVDADLNNDGEIQVSEALAVNVLQVDGQQISSLEGISAFTNLVSLSCNNNLLTSLDISALPLYGIECKNNLLTSLLFPDTIEYVHADNNNLTSLDFSATETYGINVPNNQLTSLLLPEAPQSGPYLYLNASNNPLTELDLPDWVEYLDLQNTLITSLVLPTMNWGADENFTIANNPNLQFIDAKTNDGSICIYDPDSFQCHLLIENNPSLMYLCVPSSFQADNPIIQWVRDNNNPNMLASTYCDFTPGGNYNTVSGTVSLNLGGGCSDAAGFQNINVSLNSGGTNTVFTNANGEFTSFTGGYSTSAVTLTPTFENPYFTVTPSSYVANFTGYGNTQNVNFCIAPNGTHHDLRVSIVPITVARPGFDAKYKIVCENIGTETESATLTLNFDDVLTDFVTSVPMTDTQSTGILSWNINSLAPFSSAEFTVTLNLNSPMETPPVNIDDILEFSANATVAADETQANNSAGLNEVVVGSFDPNDKAVSAEQVAIENIGEYLQYTIRFQNTGNYAAENIVVKDMLSPNLNLSTLEIISSSHPFESRLTQNKLEFIYEGINLPPSSIDEPGSNGFVSFRIKPKQTVVIGSVIENLAAIFFDFNYPIITNTVATAIVPLLSINETSGLKFSMYPNPANSEVRIMTPGSESINQIKIFNNLGQLVKMQNGASNIVALDGFPTGTYLIEITTSAGKGMGRLIKI